MSLSEKIELIAIVVCGLFALLILAVILHKKVPRKLKTNYYMSEWLELQTMLKNKQQWGEAVVKADQLLDRALRRRRYKGKSMGERMVAAQRIFTDNDDLWFAHNLCKKIKTTDNIRLKEVDVKDALIGFRQALRDLGALPSNKEATDGKS